MRHLSNARLHSYGAKLLTFAKVAALVLLAIAAVSFAAPAQSQTLTFTVKTTTQGGASVVPEVTWTTAPGGAQCTATATPAVAAWTGSQLSSGTKVLPAITATNGYAVSCTWAGSPTLKLRWAAPTTNADGSAYTDPGGYRILYGRTAADLDQSVYIQNPAARTWESAAGLATGNWYLGVRAFNAMGLESATTLSQSNPHVISVAATQTRNLEVVVKQPGPPTDVTAQ